MASRGIREAITYQPGSRYWPLQSIETGIFLGLALALAGFCFRRLGRSRTCYQYPLGLQQRQCPVRPPH
jgi:hypothetical protein